MSALMNRSEQWTRRSCLKTSLAAGAFAALPRWARSQASAAVSITGPDSLRAHALGHGLLYGVAVDPRFLDVEGLASGRTNDPYTHLVATQVNILVPENAMKWSALRPSPTTFDFSQGDRLMRFATLAGQSVRGHNLCWHEQLPAWFKSTATRENATRLLIDHIQTVAGHYRSQLQSWDVVNEAVEPKDGRPDGLRNSPWLGLIGPDYIELAFHSAAAADPAANLVYNDYDIELDTPEQTTKRGQVMMLIRRLKARNVPIHAVGVQSHLRAVDTQPGAGLQKFIRELRTMGLEVYVTEMDVNTRGFAGSSNDQDYAVAKVYSNYLGMILAEPNVPLVLTWGISDAHTWLNQSRQPWSQREDGTRQRPLPFDDSYLPTPAFDAIRTAIDTRRPVHPAQAAEPPRAAELSTLYQPFPVKGSPAAPSLPPQSTFSPQPQ
jgi:endo-1,4-beta-xylanase